MAHSDHTVTVLQRPPMNQDEFDRQYNLKNDPSNEVKRQLKKFAENYYKPFTSCRLFLSTCISFVPIISWLPKYDWKENTASDVVGGITIGIMSIPQGIAYAVLAKQDAVVGLYTSLFPPLLYMLFGTSRHTSLGPFSVISLMTRVAMIKVLGEYDDDFDAITNSTIIDPNRPSNIEVASTLTLLVGIITLIMGICRMAFLLTYLSDQVVAGFSMGATFYVFISQLKDFFGLRNLPQRYGYGYQLKKLYDIIVNLPHSNPVTLSIAIGVVIFLVIGKDYLNPFIKNKLNFKLPIPYELVAVAVVTIVSHYFDFHGAYGVKVVSKLPVGIPSPVLPRWSLMPRLFSDALSIVIVSVAVHMSLAKLFAKKFHYEVDPGQELYALGFCSIGISFMPMHPVASALGRSAVNVEAGTKTQLSTIPAALFVLSVMLYVGKFLETLPMCVLNALILVALKAMAKKFTDLALLWPHSKIDLSIWIVSFTSTVCLDVTIGLAISIFYALFTTVMREQWARWHLLGSVQRTGDYWDCGRYEDIYFYQGICLFRFDSPLLFTNVERFKRAMSKAYEDWQRTKESQKMCPSLDSENNTPVVELVDQGRSLSQHLIVDCSGFTFADYMGVSALKEVFVEMKKRDIRVYFASAKPTVLQLFEQCGYYNTVPKENFYPTIRDAVAIARGRQHENGEVDCLYRTVNSSTSPSETTQKTS